MAKKSNSELDALAQEAGEAAPAVEVEGAPSGDPGANFAVLSPEQFEAGFIGAFNMASHVSGLKALAIGHNDNQAAKGAAAAVYEIASEVEALRWLITGGNPWVMRVVAIGTFALPMARAVKAEIAERRAANDQAPHPSEPKADFPSDVEPSQAG